MFQDINANSKAVFFIRKSMFGSWYGFIICEEAQAFFECEKDRNKFRIVNKAPIDIIGLFEQVYRLFFEKQETELN